MAQITIYTRMGCGYCSSAKRLLETKGASFEERDASFAPDVRQEMIQRANGRSTFPQIFINDYHVGGCDDLYALEQEGRLDKLLAETPE